MKIVCWVFVPLFWHSEKYLQTIKNKTILLEFHLFDELHFNIYTSISNKKIETKSFFLLPIFQEAPSPFHILLSLILSLSGIKLNLHESPVKKKNWWDEDIPRWKKITALSYWVIKETALSAKHHYWQGLQSVKTNLENTMSPPPLLIIIFPALRNICLALISEDSQQ